MICHPFTTKAECEAALEAMHYEMAAIAASHGLTILQPFYIVGKNAETGEDNLDSITTKWSDPIELEDGRWGIPSIRNSFPTTYAQIELLLPPIEDIAVMQADNIE